MKRWPTGYRLSLAMLMAAVAILCPTELRVTALEQWK